MASTSSAFHITACFLRSVVNIAVLTPFSNAAYAASLVFCEILNPPNEAKSSGITVDAFAQSAPHPDADRSLCLSGFITVG